MIDFKKLIHSFFHAIHGLYHLLKSEQNFKIHIIAAVLAIILGLYLQIDYLEFIIIFIVISIVLLAEIINTVIEEILDLLHPNYHEKIKIIKDSTAGIVLFACLIALFIGSMIFIPKIL